LKAVLFDFDETLAKVNEELFAKNYFKNLQEFFSTKGISANVQLIVSCIEHITVKADGKRDNYDRFMSCFAAKTGRSDDFWKNLFLEFYESRFFEDLKRHFRINTQIKDILESSKRNGLITVLASNPIFPAIAVEKRLQWIELNADTFDLITTMEEFHYCKPDPRYYTEVCTKIGVDPEQCVMIGNDHKMDKACEKTGMKFIHVSEGESFVI